MKKNVAIKVENLSKKYQIGQKKSYLTLRDQLVSLPKKIFNKQSTEEFWALQDINFEVKQGEVIGIIGRNGAGKSTLLKILSRIVEPTTGKITMRGKVASLLEVGTGFNPELTGRDNIYLNGAILGMSKEEISQKFDEIVAFSGVKKFLDTPVKRYSSGMYVRLAFAVAAHLDADILLVDEVLAVGDVEFQKKCLGKMNDLSKLGKTVVFVSHDMSAIARLCHKTIFLKRGNIIDLGETKKIIDIYLSQSVKKQKKASRGKFIKDEGSLFSEIIFLKRKNVFSYGEPISFRLITNKNNNKKFSLEIFIKDKEKNIAYSSNLIKNKNQTYQEGDIVDVTIGKNNLTAGKYYLDINCREFPNTHIDRWIDDVYFIIDKAIPSKYPQNIKNTDGLGFFILEQTSFRKVKK